MYAETHYRLRFLPGRLYKKEPEIVCDAPSRVEPGRPVPIFIFIKDADRYSVRLDEVIVQLEYDNGDERVARFPYGNRMVDEPFWWDSINVTPEKSGLVRIIPHVVITADGKTKTIQVDNYKGTSKSPLITTVAEESLPGLDGWYQGDIHVHTFHTADQIEFGAPLEATALAAYAYGIDWLAATDHSYDLDDRVDSWSERDPHLMKWRMLHRASELLAGTFTVIPGEEVTCRTARGRNCHMLALNASRFIPGSGDGGENGLRNKTEHTVAEASDACCKWGGIACAAHPMESVSILERLILNRGEWRMEDLEYPSVRALQIHNGVRDSGYRKGRKAWVNLLLAGFRIAAFGGSDAHGDFNRRRRIGIPLLSVDESPHHVLAEVRTLVRAGSSRRNDICDALEAGRAIITEGPVIDLVIQCGDSGFRPGEEVSGDNPVIVANVISSREFGAISHVSIYGGHGAERREVTLKKLRPDNDTCTLTVAVEGIPDGLLYIRAECRTVLDKICLTNPVWIDNDKK